MSSNQICKYKKAISLWSNFFAYIQQGELLPLTRRFVFCPIPVTTGNQKFCKVPAFFSPTENIVTRVFGAVLLTKRAAPKFDDLHSLIDLVC